jgi:hypothetical protein
MTSKYCLRGRRRTYLTILKRAWSADSKMVRHSGKTPGNKIFLKTYFIIVINISNAMYGVTLNFGSNFQKLVHGKVLWPKNFFQFFPDFSCDFAFFGLDSKSVHSPAHPYAIHCCKDLILYFSIN